jgi:hypothetical protein
MEENPVFRSQFVLSDGDTSRPIVRSLSVDEFSHVLLGLEAGRSSESETWPHIPDPLVFVGNNGAKLGQIEKFMFTKVRASLPQGGYRCFMTVQFFVSTLGWTTRWDINPPLPPHPIDMRLHTMNIQGGLLEDWPLGSIDILCKDHSRPYTFSKEFNPDYYDILKKTQCFFSGTNWFKCP